MYKLTHQISQLSVCPCTYQDGHLVVCSFDYRLMFNNSSAFLCTSWLQLFHLFLKFSELGIINRSWYMFFAKVFCRTWNTLSQAMHKHVAQCTPTNAWHVPVITSIISLDKKVCLLVATLRYMYGTHSYWVQTLWCLDNNLALSSMEHHQNATVACIHQLDWTMDVTREKVD